jgi:hypothetical protein
MATTVPVKKWFGRAKENRELGPQQNCSEAKSGYQKQATEMSVKRTDENEMQLCEVKKNCKKPGAAFFSELWCLGDLQGAN